MGDLNHFFTQDQTRSQHTMTKPAQSNAAQSRGDGPYGPNRTTLPQMLAAVDLGSNSFRMVIARSMGHELQLVDRLREGVRLAGCLDEHQHITQEGFDRALRALEIFGQRLQHFPVGSVRAVGTNTLRKARNTQALLKVAQEALGHQIEVVSGQEEARLIYLGVAHSLSSPSPRLVVDIGGGSTECIIGRGFDPQMAESLYMGCVSFTQRFFPGGKINAKRMRDAETAARLELRAIKASFKQQGWDQAVGSSGTAQAIFHILRLQGWSDQGITQEGLERLRQELVTVGHCEQLSLEGLRRERAMVLPGGFAILAAVFDSLRIERMSVSHGAMREGLLYDLFGRLSSEDAREHPIRRFENQYRVDVEQARRVESVALSCLEPVQQSWGLDPELSRSFLRWSARLHEIGLSVSHGAFHKHGAYLLEHSHMPGFSMQNQELLALLVRGQRRKLIKGIFHNKLSKSRAKQAVRLCRLLRLACVLNRSRNPRQLPPLVLEAKGKRLSVSFPTGWLDLHPLTLADLDQEAEYMKDAGLVLRIAHHDEDATAPGSDQPSSTTVSEQTDE